MYQPLNQFIPTSLSLSLSRYIPTLYLHEKKENKNFDPAHTIILIARK